MLTHLTMNQERDEKLSFASKFEVAPIKDKMRKNKLNGFRNLQHSSINVPE